MIYSTCQAESCRYYHIQKDYSKYDAERNLWYKTTASFCMCPGLQTGKNGLPRKNRQVPGGSPLGLVCWTCKGKFFKPKS